MGKKWVIVVVVAVAMASFAGLSFAEKGCSKKGAYQQKKFEDKVVAKAHMILKNQDELGLSDSQVEQVKALKLKTKKAAIAQNAEIEIITLDAEAMLWEDTVDTKAVNALVDKKYALKREKAKSLVAAYAELKGILTEKQRDALIELYKDRKSEEKCSYR